MCNKYIKRFLINNNIQTLNGANDATTGGVIIFMTSGAHYCNQNQDDIDDNVVIDRIKKTKVRIITVAFG